MRRQADDQNPESTSGQHPNRSGEAPRIVVVTPAYNEEESLARVGASMFAQSLKPTLWMIVNDGSSDETHRTANELAKAEKWISILRKEREREKSDASFKAFSYGVSNTRSDWNYLMKLDADTVLPPDFLVHLVEKFESNPHLGIASGVCAEESGLASHPRGNSRMYRRECWKEIIFPMDGFGWDTVDEAFARLNGWQAFAFSDLVCEHIRSKLPDASYRFHQGRLSRHVGYYWWFVIGRAAKMLVSYGPLPSLAYFVGYLRGGFDHVSQSVKQAVKTDQRRRVMKLLGFAPRSPVRANAYVPRLDGHDPLITIAMPTLNRAKYLPKVLDAVHNISYPRDRMRLIFVDGYSTDGTRQILQDFREQHASEYHDIMLLQDRGNIPAARNLCIRNVGDAEFLVFLDSDVIVTPDSINGLVGLSSAGEIASIFYSSFSYERPTPTVKYVHTVGMGCTLIKRAVLDKVGLFDVTLPVNEDTDYCLRAQAVGYKIVQDTTIQLLHQDEGRYSPEQTIRQSIKYRSVYAKTFRLGIYRKRLILYVALDAATILGFLLHPIFLAAIVAYFIAQLVRRRNVKLAFYLTVNSLIIAPLALVGLVERMLFRHKRQET